MSEDEAMDYILSCICFYAKRGYCWITVVEFLCYKYRTKKMVFAALDKE